MTTTIAVAGKGGTGKTTLACLLIRYLIDEGRGSVLAIDADPSANLNLVLGLPLEKTIGDLREGMLAEVGGGGSLASGSGMTKQEYLDYQIEYALAEGQEVDLLAMGRPEGRGCYCSVNHILRDILDRVGRSYDYVVMDNEAGMEHLSRRTTRDVDLLYITTDPTVRGVVAAGRIERLSQELDVNVGQSYLVLNRSHGQLPPAVEEALNSLGRRPAAVLPEDPEIAALDAAGRPLLELSQGAPVYRAVRELAGETFSTATRSGREEMRLESEAGRPGVAG